MPWYAFIGHDGAQGAALRPKLRPSHLERLAALDADGRIAHAGPLVGDDGQPIGSLVVFEADDLAAAREVAAADPYVVEGVFERHELRETKAVFPRR
jgi:hypothetical protein